MSAPRPATQEMSVIPFPALLAVLTATGALYYVKDDISSPVLLGAALLAAYFTPARLPARSLSGWLARIVIFTFLFLQNAGVVPKPYDGIFSRQMNLFAELGLGELVVRAWMGGSSIALGQAALVISGMVFLSACNTFNVMAIRLFAPLYLIALTMGIRSVRSAAQPTAPFSRAPVVLAIRFAAIAAALGIGFAGYFGFFMHREELMAWGMRHMQERRMFEETGMTSNPTLGRTFDLRGSTARVLRVEGDLGNPHLRGITFEIYQAGEWGPSVDARHFVAPAAAITRQLRSAKSVRITRLTDDTPMLYAPLEMNSIRPPSVRELEWCADLQGPLQAQGVAPFVYSFTEAASDTPGVLLTPPDKRMLNHLLVVSPGIDPRVVTLAQQIGIGAKTPSARIEAVTRYLLTHHHYSLSVDPGPGEPISNFLLKHKDAHCEYFASAAVILLRALKVPSRYVTGYYAHETTGPHLVTVRQKDAHAWAESWVAGRGWVTVDATPGDGRPDSEGPPTLLLRAWEWLQDRTALISNWLGDLSTGQVTLVMMALMVPLVALGAWSQRARRLARRALLFHYTSPEQALTELALRFEAVLRRVGAPCPEGIPWREHLQYLADRALEEGLYVPDAEAFRFVDTYNEARFGTSRRAQSLEEADRILRGLEAGAQKFEHRRGRSAAGKGA